LFKIERTTPNQLFRFFIDSETNRIHSGSLYGGDQDSSNEFVNHLFSSIYSFKAERLKIGTSRFGKNSTLASDAANLPEVLNILQSDTVRFKRYNSYVRRVFPQIFQGTIRPSPSQDHNVEIVVWNEDPEMERSDLVCSIT